MIIGKIEISKQNSMIFCRIWSKLNLKMCIFIKNLTCFELNISQNPHFGSKLVDFRWKWHCLNKIQFSRWKFIFFFENKNWGHTLGRDSLPQFTRMLVLDSLVWIMSVWCFIWPFFYLHKSLVIECTVGKIKGHYRQSTVKGLHGLLLVKI